MERISLHYVFVGAVITAALFFEIAAHAATIDYDHNTNFDQSKTYTRCLSISPRR